MENYRDAEASPAEEFPPVEYEFFKNLMDTMPTMEDKKMAMDFYRFLLNMEESPIRLGRKIEAEGTAPAQPAEEIKDANFKDFDMGKLTDLDDALAN